MRFPVLLGLCLGAATPAWAQVLTADAGVRSPELPSVRLLASFRGWDLVDESGLATQFVYSPTTSLEWGAVLPLYAREVQTGSGETRLEGLGDASVTAKYALLRGDGVMRSNRVALLGKLILPTGEDDATASGTPLHPRLQLGLGSWGLGLGIAGTLVRDRHRASAAAMWEHRGAHAGFEPGDRLALDLAYWFRLSPTRFSPTEEELEWRAVAELRSRYSFADLGPSGVAGDAGLESDGILGVQLNAGVDLRGELAVVLPVTDHLDDPYGDPGVGLLLGFTLYF